MLEAGNKSNPLSVKVVGGDIDDYYANINVPSSKKCDPQPTPLFPQYSSTETQSNSNEVLNMKINDCKTIVFFQCSLLINFFFLQTSGSYDDFKAMVFQRMKEAQAKKESTKSNDSDLPSS